MSFSGLATPRGRRNTILASVAVVALGVAGALGGGAFTPTHPAYAAAVSTSGLPQQSVPSFAPLIDRVKAAVVSVKVKIPADSEAESLSSQMDNLPPEIRKFFKEFGGGPFSGGGEPQGRHPMMLVAQGSGFFISSDGYIVTNNHVVQKAKSVTVITDDGKTLDAKVVGTDPKTDLALLKVDQKGDYPFVTLANELPHIGDWVVAIGNPYGLGGTVTAGIISAEGRDIGDGPYDRFLQIDAPINRGNSGGPTFNMQGQVVGVNTAIYSPSGGSVGIGFAIPSTTVESVVTALEHGGVVPRGYLGVDIQSITPDMAESMGMKTAKGAIVAETMPGTPAAEAGLKPGDVITKLNGEAVENAGDLTRRIGSFKPSDKVELTYLRDGAEKTAQITLASQKSEKVAKASSSQNEQGATLGIQIAPAKDVAGAGDRGVAVVGVDPNGAAAEQGLTTGDVILDVSGKPVSTPEDVNSGIAAAKSQGKKAVMMRIQTADGARFVAVPFPKA
jgi:serine protease Do